MRERDTTPDPHAERRERLRRKKRHGMRVSGASARLLASLAKRRGAAAAPRAPRPAATHRSRSSRRRRSP